MIDCLSDVATWQHLTELALTRRDSGRFLIMDFDLRALRLGKALCMVTAIAWVWTMESSERNVDKLFEIKLPRVK